MPKIPAKIEGLAFGQDVVIGGQVEHTLYGSPSTTPTFQASSRSNCKATTTSGRP